MHVMYVYMMYILLQLKNNLVVGEIGSCCAAQIVHGLSALLTQPPES